VIYGDLKTRNEVVGALEVMVVRNNDMWENLVNFGKEKCLVILCTIGNPNVQVLAVTSLTNLVRMDDASRDLGFS